MPAVASGFNDDDDTGPCPECGAEVYLIADRCPKCGRWFSDDDNAAMRGGRNVRRELQVVKIVAVVLLAAALLGVAIAVAVNL